MMSGESFFLNRVVARLQNAQFECYSDNDDLDNRPDHMRHRNPLSYVQKVYLFFSRFTVINFFMKLIIKNPVCLDKLLAPYKGISRLYTMLSDKDSQELLIDLVAYRILGHKKVKLSRNSSKYWQNIKDMSELVDENKALDIAFMNARLPLHDFNPLGFDVKLYCSDPGAACIFVQKQYEYFDKFQPEEGDIVIDGGGCWGDTALYFADAVGEKGKVYSFEFIPSNIEVFESNIAENKHLKGRCEVVAHPLWKSSGDKLYFVDWGPGSRVTADQTRYDYDGTVYTKTIDDFVEERQLQKLDFIKMDIEGAEMPALHGARKSILKYHPKMAISLYHQLSDFIDIPKFLVELGLDYEYYLGHHTIYENETVLYCVPQK